MPVTPVSRRLFLGAGIAGALPSLAGCSTPLPLGTRPPASDATAEGLLKESAEAHGLEAYRSLSDINVRYEGRWRPFIDRVQPLLVDRGFCGSSEERLLPHAGIVAQAHTGPAGHKQVRWRRGEGAPRRPDEVAVWFDGRRSTDPEVLDAAALVAEGYGLFCSGRCGRSDARSPCIAAAARRSMAGAATCCRCGCARAWGGRW